MSEADEKRRAGLDALERFTEENSFGNTFRGGYSSPFGRSIGSSDRGTLTRSDIERFKASEGSIGFDDDFTFTPRPAPVRTPVRPPEPQPVKAPEPVRTVPEPVRAHTPEIPTQPPVPELPEPEEMTAPAVRETGIPSEPPVKPTAEERAAAELHRAWNTAVTESEIIVNRSRECFCVLRAKSPVGRAGYEEISRGFIDIAEVRTAVGFDGRKREYMSARFRRDHTFAEGQISREDIESEPGKLYDIAAAKGVQFTSRSNAGLAAKYLLSLANDAERASTRYFSFYRGENGEIHHPYEAEILRNAATAEKVRELFLNSGNAQTVFLLCYRLLTELEAAGYMQEFPVMILTARDPGAAVYEISEILGENAVYKIDKHYRDAADKRIRLFNAASGTKYNIEKYLPEIAADAGTHPTVFVSDGSKAFVTGKIARRAVILPYYSAENTMSELSGVYDFMRSAFIKSGISPENWQRTVEGIDVSDAGVYASYLTAQIMVTAWLVLSELTGKESADTALGGLRSWFLNMTSDPDERMLTQLRGFLRSGADGVSINRSGNVHVIAEVLNEYAKRELWRTDFAAELASLGVISRGELSLQRTATVGGRSHRVYEVVQDKLFSYGELRAVVNEFAKSAPEVTIPFAECCGHRVSLAFGDLTAGECANILISGEAGEQRYDVCGSILAGALGKEFEVIAAEISDAEDPVDDSGASYLHFGNTAEADDFLSDLLRKRKDGWEKPVMLIIEDAGRWDMSARSPLAGKILRSGGGYGIICVLTADSPDIPGKFSVNIHTGSPGFRPAERRIFGIPAGECPEKQAVLEMPGSSFLAVGALAAENGYIREPVILKL